MSFKKSILQKKKPQDFVIFIFAKTTSHIFDNFYQFLIKFEQFLLKFDKKWVKFTKNVSQNLVKKWRAKKCPKMGHF